MKNQIVFHKRFEKQYQKLDNKTKTHVKERLTLFYYDIFNPILNNHPLEGKYKGYRSINITGDLSAIYKAKNSKIFFFIKIDIHSNLYK